MKLEIIATKTTQTTLKKLTWMKLNLNSIRVLLNELLKYRLIYYKNRNKSISKVTKKQLLINLTLILDCKTLR